MQIILQEDVEKLGTRGQVVEIAEGYARNYLLPRNLALPASAGNLKRLEKIRTVLAKKTATERDQAQRYAEVLNGVTVSLVRKAGETDQLFGSVTTADLAEELAKLGHEVDKRKIQLDEPIKLLGEFQVTVKLYTDVGAQFKVVVTRESAA
ncbi:MAG TPA: 50S ribosomal protein L9 [Candidatus Limnocylindrales bacterium]|nr:50S ribosomal protein L9 [Candidatus Limnocylindrales bacterium]